MCSVRNRPSPSCDSDLPNEDSSLGTTVGIAKKIKIANSRIKLFYILNKTYKINIQTIPGQEWSLPICCPFPSHDDSTASFGYNSVKDYFHCFGCSLSGRTVEFMSIMEGRSKSIIADQILRETGGYDLLDEVSNDDGFNIDDDLFKFASDLRFLYQNNIDNKEPFSYIDKIALWIDMSLISALSSRDAVSFKRRLAEADSMLNNYSEEK